MTNALPMPADLHKAADPAKEYARLDKEGQGAYMKRVDLMYPLYVEEIARGSLAWTGRVSTRLGLDAEDKHSKAVVSYAISIFKTFRLPAPLGLGYMRAELEATPLNRLRTIATNHKWAMANPERVAELIKPEYKTTEYEINAEIKGQTTEDPEAGKFETLSFRFTSEDAKMIKEALQALHNKRVEKQELPVNGEGKIRDGNTLSVIVSEWINIAEYWQEAGGDVQNAVFMPASYDTVKAEEVPDDEAHEHAAD